MSDRIRLISTAEAARASGLSERELRAGAASGRFPVLRIGRGEERQRLRWRLDLLLTALEREMQQGGGAADD